MEGSVNMTKKLSYSEQIDAITQLMREKLELLHSLPEEEARIEARKNLQRAGVMDGQGNMIGPYAAEDYVS